jgi:hypothetical protein
MKRSLSRLALLIACAAFFSFKSNPGGEGFEIYLGGKLLTQQFGSKINEVKSLHLNQPLANEQLIIKYYHCGRTGRQRMITIKDIHDKLLKQFHYADGAAGLSLKVQELLKLSDVKKGINEVKIFYSSTELPNGRWLATLDL